jgi:cytoskeletal protein CcmA (bactofilin family)
MAKGRSGEELNGFMDQGTELVGDLRFRDTFRVDGVIKGRIVSDNTLIVGEGGSVEAEIDCGVVSVRGSVKGRIHGRQRVELLAGCRVEGSVVSPRLLIEEGAFFQGECQMSTEPASAAKPAPRPGPA